MKTFFSTSFLSIVLSAILTTMPVWAQGPSPVNAGATADPDALQIHVLNPDSLQAALHTAAKETLRVEVLDASGAAVSNAAVICRLPDSGATGAFGDGTHAALAYTDADGRATINPIEWGDVAGAVPIRLTATKGTAHTGILLEASLATPMTPTQTAVQQTATPISQTVVSVPVVSVTNPAPQPGQLAKPATTVAPATDKPNTSAPADPTVSVTRTSAADAPHSSHTKWYVLLAVVAAAGAGGAFAMKGKSNTSTAATTSSLTIGAPTISIGHP